MRERIQILGNKIDCFSSYEEFYSLIIKDIKNIYFPAGYVTVNNAHTMIEGFWNKSYQEIINSSYLSIPDGKPLQVFGKLKRHKNIIRLFGPTVMEMFIDWGRKDGISHFFFGSSEENLIKLRTQIERKYPGTAIAGMLSPPYKPVEEWTDFTTVINKAKPDFIWIGLGAPKQERWMHDNYKQIEKGILFGIGAGFDYIAGNTKHAPEWMKKFALEWLYRLIQEPGRLWKRYLKTIPQFIFFASLELAGVKFKKTNRS